MFCENCGKKVSKDDAFCPNCGNSLKKDEKNSAEETNTSAVEEKSSTEESVEASENDVNTIENAETPESSVNETPATEKKEVTSVNISGVPKEKVKKGAASSAILVILAFIILLAGVGTALYFLVFKKENKSAIETIELAMKNMEDLESYTIAINGDVITKGENSQNANFSLETSVDIKDKKAQLEAQVSSSGVKIELPAYIDFSNQKNGMVYFKLPEMITQKDEWSKLSLGSVDLDSLLSSTEDDESKEMLDELKTVIKENDLIKKEKSDDKDCNYYEIVINDENVKKLNEVYEELEITESDIEDIKLGDGFVIGIYVNKKENVISKINFDMTDYINTMADGEAEFEKLVISIEYKNINDVSKIEIPEDAKNAKEIDLNDIYKLYEPDEPMDEENEDDDIQDDDYEDDYSIVSNGFRVKYNMPAGFEASSVNSEDFKIYRNDDLRVVISNYYDSEEERFEEMEYNKEYYEKDGSYKNIALSDEKSITVNGNKFAYKELSYENSYGVKKYETMVCYQLDSNHVYRVEYEKNESPITEKELKLFLDIDVTKE